MEIATGIKFYWMDDSMKQANLSILGIGVSSAGKMDYTVHLLQQELQRALFYDDHEGRALTRKVLRVAFDVLDGSGQAAGLHADEVSNLQPRLEGALALVRALRQVLSTNGDASTASVRMV